MKLELLAAQNRIHFRTQDLHAAGTAGSTNVLQAVPSAVIADLASSTTWPKSVWSWLATGLGQV